jgi:hypothetical protein
MPDDAAAAKTYETRAAIAAALTRVAAELTEVSDRLARLEILLQLIASAAAAK